MSRSLSRELSRKYHRPTFASTRHNSIKLHQFALWTSTFWRALQRAALQIEHRRHNAIRQHHPSPTIFINSLIAMVTKPLTMKRWSTSERGRKPNTPSLHPFGAYSRLCPHSALVRGELHLRPGYALRLLEMMVKVRIICIVTHPYCPQQAIGPI